jgi:two-component system, LytTR family, response regulator
MHQKFDSISYIFHQNSYIFIKILKGLFLLLFSPQYYPFLIDFRDLNKKKYPESSAYLPQIIFTRAYHEHAVESYERNATDELLKLFSFERFIKAVFKANDNIE